MGSTRTNNKVKYEDMLNDILQTLAEIKSGRTDGLTSTYWTAKYQQDITFLLKQLAKKNVRFKTLAKHVEEAHRVLDKSSQ